MDQLLVFLSLLWVFWSCTTLLKGCCAIERHENRLINHLLKDYDADARPVNNPWEAVRVELGLSYRELKEMDEPKQAMSSITWFRIKWNDVSLKWNKSDYGGISSIRLDPSRVWKPDLILYNSVHESGGDLYSFNTKPIISSDGNVNWLAPAILKSTCKLDIKKFPFDEQKCTLKIGSWTHNSFALDLNFAESDTLNLDKYSASTEWELLSSSIKKNTIVYSCCPEPYSDLTFTFRFGRKSWYYIISVIFPCIILSLLVSISFLFPADSGERVSLVISVLLGLTVFMLIINEKTPISSDSTPMITRYFSSIMAMTFSILLATAFILRMHHASGSSPVPYYLASLRDFFAFFLCMKRPTKSKAPINRFMKASRPSMTQYTLSHDLLTVTNGSHTAGKIHDKLQRFRRPTDNDFPNSNEIKDDWQCTARVFDRLFFCIFLFVFLSLNLYVFSFLYDVNI